MKFKLSDLAPDIESAVITAWCVNEGDSISHEDDLLDITTDKASITIPSPEAGTIVKIFARENDEIKSETLLVEILN